MLLIRCSTLQLDEDYKDTPNENYTVKGSPGYTDVKKRIEQGIQHSIPTTPSLTLRDNITIELVDNGLDSQNRTHIVMNIVISSTGTLLIDVI